MLRYSRRPPNSLNDTSYLTEYIALTIAIILPLIFVIGCLTATLVGIHVIRTTWKKPLLVDRLILNLVVIDELFLFTSFIAIFPTMVKLHLRQVPIHSSNTFWCRLQFGWIMYLHIIIVYNMLALSVTRYYVVAKSNQLPHFIKNHPNWSIFIFIWLVPLLFASPPVIGYWGKYTYAQVVGLCYPDYHYQQNIYHILYFVTYFLFVPILSLIIISVSYRMILNETREKRRKIDEQTRENAVRSYIVANIFHTSEEEFIHFSREKHEKLLAKHLINICFTCICSILPLNIFMVIHFIVGTPITRKLIIIGIIFTQVANIINNFFYYLRNRENFFSFLTGNISKSNKVTCESDLT